MRTIICLILFCLLTATCSSQTGKVEKAKVRFELPTVPEDIQTPAGRGVYVARHYWDNFDFADTTLISDTMTEQAFVDFVVVLPVVSRQAAVDGINVMLDKARGDSAVFSHFTELYDKYLYDPNSPFRNEELYIVVLQYILADDDLDPLLKLRPQSQLERAMKNRQGTRATDLEYTLADGRKGRVSGVQTEYTMLFFYNPDCNMCKEVERHINSSQLFGSLLSLGRLTIVALYPDEDIAAWKRHLSQIPAAWINGYDATGETFSELYDLRAIPNIYLLDRNKTVLLKDAEVGAIEQYLAEKAF